MILIVAVLILAVLGPAGPARACTPHASSTFCPEAWVAQPTGGRDTDGQGFGTDPAFAGQDGIHVEGAVVIDDPPPEADGQL